MEMDEYELELLEEVEKASGFERVENFEDELLDARMAAKKFLNKTKHINIRIPEFDIPYQTILSSLIHQYVTEKVKPTL